MAHKFLVKRRLTLEFLGEDWKDCYIDVAPLSPNELREILLRPTTDEKSPKAALANMEDSAKRLRKAFQGGKGLADTGVVDLDSADIELLPMEVTKRLNSLILGEVDPN